MQTSFSVQVIDEKMVDEMKITVIATGFDRQPMTAAVRRRCDDAGDRAPRYDVPGTGLRCDALRIKAKK